MYNSLAAILDCHLFPTPLNSQNPTPCLANDLFQGNSFPVNLECCEHVSDRVDLVFESDSLIFKRVGLLVPICYIQFGKWSAPWQFFSSEFRVNTFLIGLASFSRVLASFSSALTSQYTIPYPQFGIICSWTIPVEWVPAEHVFAALWPWGTSIWPSACV